MDSIRDKLSFFLEDPASSAGTSMFRIEHVGDFLNVTSQSGQTGI
jgi:hypothetical protein